MDSPSERLVQKAVRTVLAGRTALIIAHRLSTVEIADRVLVMEHGRIVEDGSPGDLIARGEGRYSDLHDAWLDSLAWGHRRLWIAWGRWEPSMSPTWRWPTGRHELSTA
jgi:ABC-type multidrug transport system ATPase subunit